MKVGDIVVRKSYGKDITFKIIDIKSDNKNNTIYTLKGVSVRIIADCDEKDVEPINKKYLTKHEEVLDKKVNMSIDKIIKERKENYMRSLNDNPSIKKESKKKEQKRNYRLKKNLKTKDLFFGRPGRILHIDGDCEYLENCLKVYKQLELEVKGVTIPEKEQPLKVIDIAKQYKPDIVVITGHDAIITTDSDYTNVNNYKNSRYFVETVSKLRDYERNYDDLIIFAGACQSCYEAILNAGANYASSPGRILLHCLDPVFLCEKIAYSNVSKVVSIQEAIDNTITGLDGIGGLQTRGKYREGFPKSPYIMEL